MHNGPCKTLDELPPHSEWEMVFTAFHYMISNRETNHCLASEVSLKTYIDKLEGMNAYI